MKAACNSWWTKITSHFCVLTYQHFLHCSVNICFIILTFYCMKIKPTYYYSTEAVNWRCSVKRSVLRTSAKFTGKHLCQSLFFNKVVGSLQLYYKRDSGTGIFSVNLVKFLRTPTLKNWSNEREWRKTSEANLACLSIKVPRSSLKVFSALFKRHQTLSQWQKLPIKSKKREIRKRKATKLMQKNFELLSLFETSKENELLNNKNLLTWFAFWVCILKS